MPEPDTTDVKLPPRAYSRMALVLRLGLVVSMTLIVLALAAYVVHHPDLTQDQLLTRNPIADYLSPGGLLAGLIGLHAEAYMTLGIVLLAATPVARVFTGMWYFSKAEDIPLTWVAGTVFCMLLFGFFILGPLVK
ncbi:MAG: DUF1634 domain-containing protein [Candidatus Thermoplasmatota archaeon]|jgi:uncharacterized membrane protein|nr:DUF1634 domain-containing protein [Candidatus Thermoplasmatota archaeon]MCL5984145.1 DUF1634 domain-containing protein [Candidatus Thermoplasmatota archaeon]